MVNDKIVARFKDGSLLKGRIPAFSLDKSKFQFEPIKGEEREIEVEQLKALYWVKSFHGDRNRKDRYNDGINRGGRKIRVRFLDGEIVVGHTFGFSANRNGFFLVPDDSEGNNLGVFVVKSASERIEVL